LLGVCLCVCHAPKSNYTLQHAKHTAQQQAAHVTLTGSNQQPLAYARRSGSTTARLSPNSNTPEHISCSENARFGIADGGASTHVQRKTRAPTRQGARVANGNQTIAPQVRRAPGPSTCHRFSAGGYWDWEGRGLNRCLQSDRARLRWFERAGVERE
jgi:hypothetical protein